jgi:hypothetical protein
MRRVSLALGLSIIVGVLLPLSARAETPASPPPVTTVPVGPTSASPPVPAAVGVIVIALPGATDATWPLARAIYGDESVRPTSMDEPRARILCGEAAPPNGAPELRDLSETVASLRGDDAPSRAMLADIASRFSVRAVVVVRADAGRPSARVFLPDTRTFDAVTYAPDDGPSLSWSAAIRHLVRTFGTIHAAVLTTLATPATLPTLATHDGPAAPPRQREFYESGWFWGALGAAAFAGGTVFLATRDSSASTIHLHIEVPH